MVSKEVSRFNPLVVPSIRQFTVSNKPSSSLRPEVEQGLFFDMLVTFLDPILIILTHRVLPILRENARESVGRKKPVIDAFADFNFLWTPCISPSHGFWVGGRVGVAFGVLFGLMVLFMSALGTIWPNRYLPVGAESVVVLIAVSGFGILGCCLGAMNGLIYDRIVDTRSQTSSTSARNFQRVWSCWPRVFAWSGLVSILISAIVVWLSMSIHDATFPPFLDTKTEVIAGRRSIELARKEASLAASWPLDSYRFRDRNDFVQGRLDEKDVFLRDPTEVDYDDTSIANTTRMHCLISAVEEGAVLSLGQWPLCLQNGLVDDYARINRRRRLRKWTARSTSRSFLTVDLHFIAPRGADVADFSAGIDGPTLLQTGAPITHVLFYDDTVRSFERRRLSERDAPAWGSFSLSHLDPNIRPKRAFRFKWDTSDNIRVRSKNGWTSVEDIPVCEIEEDSETGRFDILCQDNDTCVVFDGLTPKPCSLMLVVVELSEPTNKIGFFASEDVLVSPLSCGRTFHGESPVGGSNIECDAEVQEATRSVSTVQGLDDRIATSTLLIVGLVCFCCVFIVISVCYSLAGNTARLGLNLCGLRWCSWCCADWNASDAAFSSRRRNVYRLEASADRSSRGRRGHKQRSSRRSGFDSFASHPHNPDRQLRRSAMTRISRHSDIKRDPDRHSHRHHSADVAVVPPSGSSTRPGTGPRTLPPIARGYGYGAARYPAANSMHYTYGQIPRQ